jgi:RND family efflux transporter MFP subunit
MDNPPTNNDALPALPAKRRMRPGKRRLWIGGAALVAAIAVPSALFFWRPSRKEAAGPDASFTMRKMDLVISSVLEGGRLVSPSSLEITSRVEGQATILSVVPEGTVVTPEDVENEKVLMELDSSALRDKANQQEVAVEASAAALTQARDSYEIEKNVNDNSIKGAELKAKFARMELEKYLGAALTPRVLEGEISPATFYEVAGTESEVPADVPKTPEASGTPRPGWSAVRDAFLQAVRVINGQEPVSLHKPKDRPKGSALKLETLHLGGTARQDLRKFQANIELANEELNRQATTYQWSKKLGPKELGGAGYIAGTEVTADYLALKRCGLALEQAKLDLDIFLRYELPKQTELLLSAYRQTFEELELERARVRADLDKAEAQVKSAEAAYRREKVRLDKLNEQIAACLIYATCPGIVAYPRPSPSGGGADKIQEGATVRERQPLLTILGEGNLAVKVTVHKASVNQIRRGQEARIALDGFPNREYSGRVEKVLAVVGTLSPGRIPDPQEFNVIVTLDNPPADLKAGVSAQVEILIAKLTGVLAAPTQAVTTADGRQICYVARKRRIEPRVVETGPCNDEFIEITRGLEPGEKVLLHAPMAAGAPTAATATAAVTAAAAVSATADEGEAKRPKPASPEAEGPKPAVAPKNPTP